MRSERSVAVVAFVGVTLLVALAGCAGVLDGGGDGTPNPTETTPDSQDEPNATLAPGVNDTRLIDADALLSAHRETMAQEGFAYTFEHRQFDEVVDNGSNTTKIVVAGEVRASPGLSAFRRTVDRDLPVNETTGVWTNGTAGFERVVGDETSYERRYANATKRDTTHYVMERHLEGGEWNVTDVTDDDRIVLVADSRVGGVVVEGRLVVDDRGRIHELNATMVTREYDDDVEGRVRHHRTLVYEVTAVGEVPVSPPDWVDDARNATG